MRSHSATSAPAVRPACLIVVEMAPANRRDVSAEFCNARGLGSSFAVAGFIGSALT